MRARTVAIALVVVLAVYLALVGWRGVVLVTDGLSSGDALSVVLGASVLVFPVVGVGLVWREVQFGRDTQALADDLATRGALPVDDLPRRPSGRVDRAAARQAFDASHSMAFALRPGFKLIRLWDNIPGMYNLSYEYHRGKLNILSPSPALLPPHHPDGGRERRDEINWPVIKPYLKTINGRGSYHYYANGRLVYEDDFSDNRILLAADSVIGLSVESGRGVLANEDDTGEAVFTLELPYVFVGGTVSGRVELVDGGWVAVYMDLGDAEQWACLGVSEKGGRFSFDIPAILLDERYHFRVKLKLHGAHGPGSALLHEVKIDGVCQLNMHSLPYLAPGVNNVTASAGSVPAGCGLKVTYEWNENGWDREHTHILRGGSETYAVEVAGEEYPKMKALIMEADPERAVIK